MRCAAAPTGSHLRKQSCVCRTGYTFAFVGDAIAPTDLVERQRAFQTNNLLANPLFSVLSFFTKRAIVIHAPRSGGLTAPGHCGCMRMK